MGLRSSSSSWIVDPLPLPLSGGCEREKDLQRRRWAEEAEADADAEEEGMEGRWEKRDLTRREEVERRPGAGTEEGEAEASSPARRSRRQEGQKLPEKASSCGWRSQLVAPERRGGSIWLFVLSSLMLALGRWLFSPSL